MGCVCCSLSSFISILLDALERISLCTVCAMLTCCLMLTLITVMMMGIGIGFHYCFVQHSVETMDKAVDASAGSLGDTRKSLAKSQVMRSVDKAMERGFPHRLSRREADIPPLTNNINSSYALETNFTTTNTFQSSKTNFTSANVSTS